jgi:hypothetical protein
VECFFVLLFLLLVLLSFQNSFPFAGLLGFPFRSVLLAGRSFSSNVYTNTCGRLFSMDDSTGWVSNPGLFLLGFIFVIPIDIVKSRR